MTPTHADTTADEQRSFAATATTATQGAHGAGNLGALIESLLERRGKFQILLIVLLCLNSIIIGINHTITSFHIYIPDFYCVDEPETQCGNSTGCPSGYKFDETDDRTVATEFNMVCNRAMMAPLVNSLYFAGVTIGSLICSGLCDIYGRRLLVLLCLYGQAIMALGQVYSSGLYMFIVFRFLQGFFIQGLQTCSYTLAMEYCPSKYRTIAATYWESNWAIGLGIMGAVAYFIRDWRMLTLALTTPALLSLAYTWIFPESLAWLEAKGRTTEALRLVRKIAQFNHQTDIVSQCDAIQLLEKPREANAPPNEEIIGLMSGETCEKVTIGTMLSNQVLRKHVLSMVGIWFSVTLSYYGILYYLPNLAGQRHLNFEIGALIELIAYILAFFILSDYGRRLPMAFYQYSNGVLILLIAILASVPAGSYTTGVTIVITLLAKGLAVSCFCGMFIYCSELLPTICRGMGLGICGCSARCGSLLAPQLMALTSVMPEFIPLSIMSVLLLFTATVTLFLPETLSTILPNTIAEADQLWSRKRK